MAAQTYPTGIDYRQPRPRGDNGLAAIVLGALGWWLAGPVGGIAGGAVGSTQPLPLEAAIRSHFAQLGMSVIAFYRLGSSAAQVLFSHNGHFWTITSRANENPDWTPETLDDWLYGDMVSQLTERLRQISSYPPA